MGNEMHGQFHWSESGLQLLNEIKLYIKLNGGEKALYYDIISGERKERERIYKNSLVCAGRKNDFNLKKRRTKKVILMKNGKYKIFQNALNAALYVGVTEGYIRNAIMRPGKCKGWDVRYSKKSV